MERVLETGVYCSKCDCLIKNKDLAKFECSQCEPDLSNWKDIEIVLRERKDDVN